MTWREVVYEYDGSFDGLLCCIYESIGVQGVQTR